MVVARNDPLDNVMMLRESIRDHHLWFIDMMMRAFIQEHDLVGCAVAFCKGCHETFSEQILDNYKMMERFDEGARFLFPCTRQPIFVAVKEIDDNSMTTIRTGLDTIIGQVTHLMDPTGKERPL